jgi:Icc-related predicted phosphoesterase
MKIVAFSDIHGQQNKQLTEWFNNNPADLLLFAGDLQRNQTDFGMNFVAWVHSLPYTKKVLVFGNHDGNSADVMNFIKNNNLTDIVFLNNESITVDGIKIFGSPHSVLYGSWWFMMKDEELASLWKKIPDDTDILITHGPPLGILDDTIDGFTTGSKTLLRRVFELQQLKYHIFGHIHESHGKREIGERTFMNVSLLDEQYRFKNKPVIFDYEAEATDINTNYNIGE